MFETGEIIETLVDAMFIVSETLRHHLQLDTMVDEEDLTEYGRKNCS